MATSVSGVTTNFFPTAQNGFTTTTSGSVSSGAATVGLNSVAGYTNGDVVVLVIDPTDASKKQTFTGVVDTSGSQITSVKWTAGTNQTHALGATVVDYETATHWALYSKGIRISHATDGTLLESAVRAALNLGTASTSGWEVEAELPDTITYNGNRSYTLVFNTTDLTDTLSEGMKMRLTRTVSAPTQCTDLEASSSQYFSKTSPSGISFTVTWTAMAWVKLESYTEGGIIGRRNGDTEGWHFGVNAEGRVEAGSLRIAGNNSVTRSYQSIPLNKWVHVAGAVDLAGTSLIYIDGVLVPSLTTVTGTAATLVQGTTALTVGAQKSAGTFPFDGKIAQAAVFSSKLSAATIASYASQTLSGSEPTCVGCFTLSNSLVDTSSNANTVTAQGGALATNVDSPFGNYLGGTLEYGIISSKPTFSTNTTITVQVPEGCAIPTTGGISAVAYSTQGQPYLFPTDKGQWDVMTVHKQDSSQASSVSSTWYNIGSVSLTVPIGKYDLSYECPVVLSDGTNAPSMVTTLSTGSSSETDNTFTSRSGAPSVGATYDFQSRTNPVTITTATPYYLNHRSNQGTNTATLGVRGSTEGAAIVKARLTMI
jgi:hypothetical protein